MTAVNTALERVGHLLGDAMEDLIFGRSLRAGPRWLPVPGYEGFYEVSDAGEFRSLYFDPPRNLRLGKDRTGYPTIMLERDGKRRPYTAHRLVARSFLGEQPNPLHREVAHLDGDRTNCRADNLKWVSKVENMSHMRRHGTALLGSKAPQAKLTEEIVSEIRAMLRPNYSALARQYGVHPATLRKAAIGGSWRSVAIPIARKEEK